LATAGIIADYESVYGLGFVIISIILAHQYGFLRRHFKLFVGLILTGTLGLVEFSVHMYEPNAPLLVSISAVAFIFIVYFLIWVCFAKDFQTLAQELKDNEPLIKVGRNVSYIIHDFKNDMALLSNFVMMLEKLYIPFDEESLKKLDTYILRLSERTKRLSYAASVVTLDKETVIDIGNILHSAVEILKLDPEVRKRIEITTRIEHRLFFRCIPADLHAMFENLILNARDAVLHSTKEKGSISVSAGVENEFFLFVDICDTGTGIRSCAGRRCRKNTCIGCPIFRKGTSSKKEGSGLGMSLVMDILKKYGGNLRIISQQGVGTQVRIFLGRTR